MCALDWTVSGRIFARGAKFSFSRFPVIGVRYVRAVRLSCPPQVALCLSDRLFLRFACNGFVQLLVLHRQLSCAAVPAQPLVQPDLARREPDPGPDGAYADVSSREDPVAAAAAGVNVRGHKMVPFLISAGYAGYADFAGSLYAHMIPGYLNRV